MNTAPRCILGGIRRRLYQHRYGELEGFAQRYHLNRLVWIEHFRNVNDAIACEKKPKGLASQQENCSYRANESSMARSE
jgi:predicted GIY-YIG superfamily endonuclease